MHDVLENDIFVRNVYYLAKMNNLKIGEIEQECKVSVGYLSRLSKENSMIPNLEFIYLISKKFNYTIETLLFNDLSAWTGNEKYLNDFFIKVYNNTKSGKTIWNFEKAKDLNSYESRLTSIGNALFSLNESDKLYFNSFNFAKDTIIKGDCYECKLDKQASLYLMNVGNYHLGNNGESLIEVWINYGSNIKYLGCDSNTCNLKDIIHSLYIIISESVKHPFIEKELKNVLDSYMDDNHFDLEFISDEDIPF